MAIWHRCTIATQDVGLPHANAARLSRPCAVLHPYAQQVCKVDRDQLCSELAELREQHQRLLLQGTHDRAAQVWVVEV
jgi:hypothetical protein